ncbi:MAG TPA: serine hydrolase domain-containing protein [Sphingomonas sp.]|nr:serine hydrolase domain-containing protein [Sphingomonas sp.]
MQRRQLLAGMAVCSLAGRAARARTLVDDGAAIDAWAAANRFAGVAAIGRRGKAIATRCFGLASIEDQQPATPTTKYAIGSISKWFTTAAVLRLCDQGCLTLDAPLATWLPAIEGAAGTEVRLVDLLCNSSGIPDRLIAAAKTDPAIRSSEASAGEMVARFVTGDLAFVPGARFDYTVLNWVIVRALLERVTGAPFAALMRDLVLEPAGVPGVGIAEHGFAGVPGLAPAYRSSGPPVRKLDSVPGFAAASGTFYANAGDLVTAAHAIFGARLLSPTSRKAMLTVRMVEDDYAIGGRVRVLDGRTWAWETGRIGGYRAHVAHDTADDRTIVVLGNTDMDQGVIEMLVETLAGADGRA